MRQELAAARAAAAAAAAAAARDEALAEVVHLKGLLSVAGARAAAVEARAAAEPHGGGAGAPAGDGDDAAAQLRGDLDAARSRVAALSEENASLKGQVTVANELLARMQSVKQALQSIRRRGSAGELAAET